MIFRRLAHLNTANIGSPGCFDCQRDVQFKTFQLQRLSAATRFSPQALSFGCRGLLQVTQGQVEGCVCCCDRNSGFRAAALLWAAAWRRSLPP